MQLVGTRARDHRGDRVSGLGAADPCRWASVRRLDPVAAAQAPGAHGGRYRVGPGRGARLSTDPFPRTALRTRRASHPGTGLSTRPATKQSVALALGSAASLCPFAMCTPVARSDYYSHSATTLWGTETRIRALTRTQSVRRRCSCSAARPEDCHVEACSRQ